MQKKLLVQRHNLLWLKASKKISRCWCLSFTKLPINICPKHHIWVAVIVIVCLQCIHYKTYKTASYSISLFILQFGEYAFQLCTKEIYSYHCRDLDGPLSTHLDTCLYWLPYSIGTCGMPISMLCSHQLTTSPQKIQSVSLEKPSTAGQSKIWLHFLTNM